MNIFGQLRNPHISDGTQIYNLEYLVSKLINSKLENLDLASKQDLSELERKFEAKTEMMMTEMSEQVNIVNRIKLEFKR